MNEDIKSMMRELKVTQARTADVMGVTKEWVCRLLSKPLSGTERARIVDAITRAAGGTDE